MKTLKLNMLEKSEMNEIRGGWPQCAEWCENICGGTHGPVQRGGEKGGAPASKTMNVNSYHGHIWNNSKWHGNTK